jgi:hypothetical protein
MMFNCLIFVPFIIRLSTDLYHSLFFMLAPTCFDSSLPSSGSFLDPPELLEIQIEWVVYHTICGYVNCVPECRGTVGTMTFRHTGHVTTYYKIYHPFDLYFR